MSTATRSASAQRFASRARRRRIRRILAGFGIVLALAAAGGAAWLIGWSAVLAVEDVRVTGVEGELAAEVERTAEVPMGVPLIRIDTDEVAARVRELPDVGDVDVDRSWPRRITVEVEPRIAVAAVQEGDDWWGVDETGVLFGRADAAPDGVPVMVAPTEESAQLARATGVAVLTTLPREVEDMVDTVEVESAADVRLILHDGATVRWGTDERGEAKARVLLALVEQHEDTPSVYDVSAPDNPSVVP